jgi:hypothetical protein
MTNKINVKQILILLPILFTSLKTWAIMDSPKLTPIYRDLARLDLGSSATHALEQFDPQFEIMSSKKFLSNVQSLFIETFAEETPQAAIGDFNGDSTPDVALMGISHGRLLTVALISSRNVYKPVVIQESSDKKVESKGLINYLVKLPAENKFQNKGSLEKKFKNDAIKIETFLGPSHLYYFEEGKFNEWTKK